DAQSQNPYAYGGNNPVTRSDPTGMAYATPEEPEEDDDDTKSPTNNLCGSGVADGCGGRGPTGGGGGRGGSGPVMKGRAGVNAVGARNGWTERNNVHFKTSDDPPRDRVPDYVIPGEGKLAEVKNSAKVYDSAQLRDYAAIADHEGLSFELWVSGEVSGPVAAKYDVFRYEP
ncbi:MAG: putative toxin, partial [Chloroflexota bacterium]